MVLLVLGQFGSVGLAGNSYPGPLYLLAASLAGWMLVYEGAHLLARVPAVSGAFSALGRATMPIVILHFLAFKPVTWLGLLATGGESYLLAAFPIYFTGGAWWVAYTAAGFLIMPLLTLLHLSPCLQAFAELCPWMGVARGVLVTAAVMAVTVFFTNRRLFWRT